MKMSTFMRKFLSSIFKKIASKLDNIKPPVAILVANEEIVIKERKEIEKPLPQSKKEPKEKAKKKKTEVIPAYEKSLRDFAEMMENPFLALSKKRKNPISYESPDGRVKIKVSRHTGHYLASIYDWDIILFVASKMQKILNTGSDIPPRTIIFPRHEILKSLHKHDGKKEEKDLKSSLARLKMTGIETTIRNEDQKYDAGFGFLDSWKYVERENDRDVRKIEITLSQWLYDGICARGSLLKVPNDYFDITSAFKRFLYRTARKHVGNNQDSWEFSVEKLYEKSGSESEFKIFKNKLKTAVLDNDIPEYSMKWIVKNKKSTVFFTKSKIHQLEHLIDKFNEGTINS